ncbi:DNA adenine methylase [Geosporobacter ferrireducens]|uniref:Site-specific DNA-methyltransferase (adenine-specific) n=1 Tax=Geosporobacter ferrireducens TaxID=1424294 RepID=A0A1D8GBQ2_9FIRM|nr:Dam family site-specific DNA-(adenine-N6)-methyltransferase [Geosporobacter ferrireducens]AOT68329.1 DNA methyltransferase [Geosporobacter ferrireducens]
MSIAKKVAPFIKWPGGKRWFVQAHLDIIPQQYNRYIEPFLGGGAVFFGIQPLKAILSDTNKELAITYNAIKKDYKRVLSYLQFHKQYHSEEYYYQVRDMLLDDEFEIAARLIYLNRTCFNGIYRVNKEGKFNVPIGTSSSVIYDTDDFQAIAQALKHANIFNDDFAKTIGKAREGDLIFADPPYTVRHNNNGFIQYNEKLFSWKDQIRLTKCLKRAKDRGVKIIATNANHPSVVDLYRQLEFEIEEITRYSSISANPENRKQYGEIIITANI